MSKIYTPDYDHSLKVDNNPTATFSNGMVLWLAEKGQTVNLSLEDVELLQLADQYIKRIGMDNDR